MKFSTHVVMLKSPHSLRTLSNILESLCVHSSNYLTTQRDIELQKVYLAGLQMLPLLSTSHPELQVWPVSVSREGIDFCVNSLSKNADLSFPFFHIAVVESEYSLAVLHYDSFPTESCHVTELKFAL